MSCSTVSIFTEVFHLSRHVVLCGMKQNPLGLKADTTTHKDDLKVRCIRQLSSGLKNLHVWTAPRFLLVVVGGVE
jgi:hypothetical protein